MGENEQGKIVKKNEEYQQNLNCTGEKEKKKNSSSSSSTKSFPGYNLHSEGVIENGTTQTHTSGGSTNYAEELAMNQNFNNNNNNNEPNFTTSSYSSKNSGNNSEYAYANEPKFATHGSLEFRFNEHEVHKKIEEPKNNSQYPIKVTVQSSGG